jgi:NAD(P)-dependent dehydrogenase (short-subunit alcohol dehydrogenase family)/acyl dehydratase
MPDEPGGTGRRVSFGEAIVQQFAAASGDHNPLHVDPGFARRTPFGDRVVHGALLAIAMLGSIPPEQLAGIRAVRVWFAAPLLVGGSAEVSVDPSPKDDGTWEVRLTGRGRPLARLRATPSATGPAPAGPPRAGPPPDGPGTPMRSTPAEPSADEPLGGLEAQSAYATRAELRALAAELGAERLDPALLEGLAWASYAVGMEVPGLHSLFSGVTLAVLGPGGPASGQSLRVRDHDARTGRLVADGTLYDAAGGERVAAVIESFARTPAPAPDPGALAPDPGTASASAPHAPGTESGAVVVIGGSRGFGAALSLALLARGYTVHVVYSASDESAAELVRLAGDGARLELHRLDAGDAVAVAALARSVAERGLPVSGLVLNAARSPLAMGLTAESGSELADYVADSVRLAAVPLGAMLAQLGEGSWVVFSSSAALSAPPRDWPHYVSAKAALEGLARWLAAAAPATATVVLRPPAMRTEMTNTPTGQMAAVAVEPIAAWLADRLAGGELVAGLSVLEPAAAEVPGR